MEEGSASLKAWQRVGQVAQGRRQANQTMGVREKPVEMEGRGKSDSHFGLGTGLRERRC